MAELLRMPEVAANASEAILQEWLISESDKLSAEDVIATIETEKAVVDVEAETDGVVLRLLVPTGASVAVGAPIAVVGDVGETVEDVDALLVQLGATPGTTPQVASIEPGPAPAAAAAIDVSSPDTPGVTRVFASPLARKLARESGIDYRTLQGSGPHGRIRKSDVEAAASPPARGSDPVRPRALVRSAAAPVATDIPIEKRTEQTGTTYTEIDHTRLRRAVASRLTMSKQTVPHFYVRGTANVEALIELRARINASAAVKVSFNDLVLKAAAVAHTLHPQMNVIWTDDAVRSYDQVDVSVAIASERGLITPVLRSVESMTVTAVAAAVKDFVERANAGRLRQDELEGGALSISNLGMLGTEEFTAIINPPHAAILAVGAIRDEPVVRGGELAVGKVLRFVLSVDHRPVDGASAADWMRTFLAVLEDPIRIIT